MFGLSYREHKTNEYASHQVDILAGRQEVLLSIIKRRKLSLFGHVCHLDALPKIIIIIIQVTVDGIRRGGRPRKMEGQHRGMHRPVDVVFAAHRR